MIALMPAPERRKDPTPAQIRKRSAQIRAGWDDETYERRAPQWKRLPVEFYLVDGELARKFAEVERIQGELSDE